MKTFLISAVPDRDNWCETDQNYYSHMLEEVERHDDAPIQVFDTYISAEDSEHALDMWHSNWPITCLDNWDIDCNEMNPEPRKLLRLQDEFDNGEAEHFTNYDYLTQLVDNGRPSVFKEFIKEINTEGLITFISVTDIRYLFRQYVLAEILKRTGEV